MDLLALPVASFGARDPTMLDSRAAIAWNAGPMFNRITFLLAASTALAACTAETPAPTGSSPSPAAAAATGTVAKFSLGKTA